MRELVRQRATVSFALMLLVTLISFWLTAGRGGSALLDEGHALIWTQVVLLAFIKVRWVMLDFMELRSAPRTLRAIYEAWTVGVAALLIAFAWLVS